MALPSTIFKADLQLSDLDRHHYQAYNLTLARHPSETDERMMMRLLAFALNASERLAFAQGLSSTDEPDLWEKDLQGSITRWIMVGLPDEKQIKKASSRSLVVIIYAYGGSAVTTWWKKLNVEKISNLTVVDVPLIATTTLAKSAKRSMRISCNIEDRVIWWTDENETVEIHYTYLKNSALK